MSTDDQIVEALAGHRKGFRWSSGNGYFCDCGKRIASTPEDSLGCWEAHLAEVIEPIIKSREAATLKEFRRLAVRSYPKGLTSTGIMIGDINERIRRLEDENSEGN